MFKWSYYNLILHAFRHILNQETNKHANETKGLFKEISEYTRVGRYEQNDHRQVIVYLNFIESGSLLIFIMQ